MKKILKITGILALIIAIAGFWGYDKFFRPDPVIQQQLREQFGEDFFSFEDIELSGDTGSNNSAAVGENDKGEKGNSSPQNTPNQVNAGVNKANEENKDSAPVKEEREKIPTPEQVGDKYHAKFMHLQDLALSRLDILFAAALQEYKEGKVNESQLAQKYIQASTTLEANVDSQFYSVLTKLEEELKENKLATDIVKVYREQYENAKSAKRSQLLAQVRR
ncbi:hypothetical protein [Desulfosporosinus youngiae]|uniref:Uncharacterized protein n=1 Tax=Desulfosporosinus youngiae DSM 17734 TaxID=768710 RepID=H5XZA3_9FIRM|nr:hypothetical protein [Desulfosporosinus youngiae]EHQ91809.1 hypothetical protein DesyoDRAFT_4866 [Desulfosporosinus youngiae DSM 17734]